MKKWLSALACLVILFSAEAADTLTYHLFKFNVSRRTDTFMGKVVYPYSYQLNFPIFQGGSRADDINALMPERIFDEKIFTGYYQNGALKKGIDSAACFMELDSMQVEHRTNAEQYYYSFDDPEDIAEVVTLQPYMVEFDGKVVWNKNGLATIKLDYSFLLGMGYPYYGTRWYNIFGDRTFEFSNAFELVDAADSFSLLEAGKKHFMEQKAIKQGETFSEAGYFSNDSFYLTDNFGITQEGLAFTYQMYEISTAAQMQVDFIIPWESVKLKEEYAWIKE